MSSEERNDSQNITITRKTVFIALAILLVAGLVIGASLGAFESLAKVFQGEEIVATVNGEEITKEEFAQVLEQQKLQYQMQGIDLNSEEMLPMLKDLEQQVLYNNFIIPILLQQKAKETITVSEEEVEEHYQQYVAAFGGEAELEQQMEAANISRKELDEEIIRELSIDKYLESYMEKYLEDHPEERIDEDIEFSLDEIEDYYQQLREAYDEMKKILEENDPEMPLEQVEMQYQMLVAQYGDPLVEDNFAEIKPLLEKTMRQGKVGQAREEKMQRVIMEHIEDLQEKSEIEIFI